MGEAKRRAAVQLENVDIEAIYAAHDAMHKDQFDVAHECLHKALGVDNDLPLPVGPIGHIRDFEEAFNRLARKHGMRAAYILVDEKAPSLPNGAVRLLKGGNAQLSALLDRLRL